MLVPPSKPRPFKKKDNFVKVTEDFPWNELSKQDLEELNRFFGENRSLYAYQSKIVVLPDDIMTTEGMYRLSLSADLEETGGMIILEIKGRFLEAEK